MPSTLLSELAEMWPLSVMQCMYYLPVNIFDGVRVVESERAWNVLICLSIMELRSLIE